MQRREWLLVALMIVISAQCRAEEKQTKMDPEVYRLWTGDAPDATGQRAVDIPTLTLFRPANATKPTAAIIVCPGGGYESLAQYEGEPVARWLSSLGITGAVLKYRLGKNGYHHPVEMHDAQRAIRLMRSSASDWNIDPKRVGILGFSAGGHLASTAATHFDEGDSGNADVVERCSCRPDLAILIYPVITMKGEFAHRGSRKALLGDKPDPKLADLLSNETQVTEKTPPCFIVHGADDKIVPVQDSLMFAAACQLKHVPMELHIFEHGAHGFGLATDHPDGVGAWTKLAEQFLNRRSFLP